MPLLILKETYSSFGCITLITLPTDPKDPSQAFSRSLQMNHSAGAQESEATFLDFYSPSEKELLPYYGALVENEFFAMGQQVTM